MKERYDSPGGHTAAGVAMIVAGTGASASSASAFWGPPSSFEAPVLLGALAALCAASIRAHRVRHREDLSFSNSFKTYRDIIATRTYCYLDEIAQRTSRAPRRCARRSSG